MDGRLLLLQGIGASTPGGTKLYKQAEEDNQAFRLAIFIGTPWLTEEITINILKVYEDADDILSDPDGDSNRISCLIVLIDKFPKMFADMINALDDGLNDHIVETTIRTIKRWLAQLVK
ncbi:MAG: hypothetical protein HQL95_08090 [Magnetococcales bacterium]|nr:hypothetical protein [Magnetococcales bacterium]